METKKVRRAIIAAAWFSSAHTCAEICSAGRQRERRGAVLLRRERRKRRVARAAPAG
jgi:hypothetical protein